MVESNHDYSGLFVEIRLQDVSSENKGNAFVGYAPLESIKTLSFATITNVIGSAVN